MHLALASLDMLMTLHGLHQLCSSLRLSSRDNRTYVASLLDDVPPMLAGAQNVFKGGNGPVQGAPHGTYAPAPYPNNGYPAQPVPGYPAGNSALLSFPCGTRVLFTDAGKTWTWPCHQGSALRQWQDWGLAMTCPSQGACVHSLYICCILSSVAPSQVRRNFSEISTMQ